MNASVTKMVVAMLGWTGVAAAAEALPLPDESPDAALEALANEAAWDEVEATIASDRLVVVAAAVGDEIVLEPGFRVVNVEIQDLWIADVALARRGKGVVVTATQPGVTRLVAADADGWVLEYELQVAPGVESPELRAFEVPQEVAEPVPAVAGALGPAEGGS